MAITRKMVALATVILSSISVGENLPNTFEAGNPIVASEVNENFQALKNRIDVLEAQLAQANADAPKQFVGLTTATTGGAAGGVAGINQLCASEYAGASMCMAHDLVGASTADFGANAAGEQIYAWVDAGDPEFVVGASTTSMYWPSLHLSHKASETVSCYNWVQYNGQGATVVASFNAGVYFTKRSCNSAQQVVACCQ